MKEITNIIYSTFAVVALACFALLPKAQAVSPPPDGGYPNFNTAEGDNALFSLTTGAGNTANGYQALVNNTTGNENTANGSGALGSNTAGSTNTATGVGALASNTSGSDNTATGVGALGSNITGFGNTASGVDALLNNTTINGVSGDNNTATGVSALQNNTTGFQNTANGSFALESNTTGINNTANGYQALVNNTTGNNNTAIGVGALQNATGNNNIAIGNQAGVNLTGGSNAIEIGNPGVAPNQIRIGVQGTQTATFIAGIYGSLFPNGVQVVASPQGRLGTTTSSARFKEAIKPMDKASETILALKPVTFRYKKELDPEGIPQFGLVAEEVEKVNSALVARDANGKPYTVRYEAVNAMLLNEFLKEHRTVQELKTTVAKQQKQIERLTAGLQKVSDHLELNKPARRIVNNQ
jgi:hypothetical protein